MRKEAKIGLTLVMIVLAAALAFTGIQWKISSDELIIANGRIDSLEHELSSKIDVPGDFGSVSELEDWVKLNVQLNGSYLEDSFRSALKIQEAGLMDGYLISVMVDISSDFAGGVIFCGALVNGELYAWHPSHEDVLDFYSEHFGLKR